MSLLALFLAPLAIAAPPNWTWEESPLSEPIELNVAGFPSEIGTADEVEAALEAAIATWNIDGDSKVVLAYGGRSTVTQHGGGDDGHNLVDAFDTGTGTELASHLFTEAAVGEAIDCDMRLHLTNQDGAITWTTDSAGATAGEYDVERGFLRLLGFCLGLDVSDDDASVVADLLEEGTGVGDRSLLPVDVSALQAIYGAAEVVIEQYSHAVIYDVDDPNGDRRGAPGESALVRVQVVNEGDTAYDLTGSLVVVASTASLSAPYEAQAVGDLLPGEFAQFVFEVAIDDCAPNANTTEFQLNLRDARGDSFAVPFDTWIQCADPNQQLDDTGPVDDEGCNCAATGSTGGWLALMGVPLLSLARRRHARPLPDR